MQSCQRRWKSWSRLATLMSLWTVSCHCHTRSPQVGLDSTNSANCVQLYDHSQLTLPRHWLKHSSSGVWTTATRCCMVSPTASSGSCSQSRTLLHVWLLVPDGVVISHQFWSCYIGCQSGDGLTTKWHAWCTSHCRAMHPDTWLTTSTLLPTVVVAHFDQHMTGHARDLGHRSTPASATEVSASLDHVCGTRCRRLCDKTTDSLSDNWKHFCFGVR